jgi:ribosomal protein S18 acetylase RimI-like enzyme
MRATEFITELFKPGKKNWKWARLGRDEASAFFNVAGREYLWQAFTPRSNPKKWEIQFRLIRKSDVDPDDLDLFGTTGTGNSTEVMSTAVDITRAFLKDYGLDNVEEITFNAKEDSRIGLYAKMIKRLLPNWDLHSKKDPYDGMVFTLTDRRAYDKPENKLNENKKIARYNGLIMGYVFNDTEMKIKAYDPTTKTPIAFVEFVKEDKELYPQNLWTHDDYRNRGIAKSMYDFLKDEGYIINRSHDQTKAGTGFWDKHRGEDAYVWEEGVSIKLSGNNNAKEWIEKVYTKYPYTMQNNHVMVWGEGDAQQFAVFELTPSFSKRGAVEVKWFQAYPLRQGVGSRAMKDLQALAKEDGITLTLFPWDKGQVSQSKLTKFYKGQGFKPTVKGSKTMFWDPSVNEEIIDEMPLPTDWDPQQMRQQGTSFKSRLAYALERAKKLGVGSSRVATTIEYQGRPTVLKIAKNQKGLAQNSVEASILEDGYASQLGILIPLIDYDEQNREPTWIHTEMATKASEKQLCTIIKCDNLSQLVSMAWSITGKKKYLGTYQGYVDYLRQKGKSEQDIETVTEYANILADLNSNFDVELADFGRASNWGLYQGKPTIIDVGFNSNVLNQYYSR